LNRRIYCSYGSGDSDLRCNTGIKSNTPADPGLTVDEHQLVQEGLAAMINREEDMTVVATASSGEEAIDRVRRHKPDVVTLDLLLPDTPGEDLARRILAEFRTRES